MRRGALRKVVVRPHAYTLVVLRAHAWIGYGERSPGKARGAAAGRMLDRYRPALVR